MFAARRIRRVLELVALRLSLPSRLARAPLDALLDSLAPSPARSAVSARAVSSLKRDIVRTEWVMRHLPWPSGTCLYRALARYAVLRRTGVDATFVMGVGPQGVQDDGHAWVEVDGSPYEEPDDVSRFAVTFRYPSTCNAGKLEAP